MMRDWNGQYQFWAGGKAIGAGTVVARGTIEPANALGREMLSESWHRSQHCAAQLQDVMLR